jgi:hypothetical protein
MTAAMSPRYARAHKRVGVLSDDTAAVAKEEEQEGGPRGDLAERLFADQRESNRVDDRLTFVEVIPGRAIRNLTIPARALTQFNVVNGGVTGVDDDDAEDSGADDAGDRKSPPQAPRPQLYWAVRCMTCSVSVAADLNSYTPERDVRSGTLPLSLQL